MYLQRTIGNRAVGQLLQANKPVIQRDLVKYDEILPPETHRRWMPLKTEIDDDNEAVGYEAQVEGAGGKWQTKVEWDAADHDDGVKMVADPLGPDHPLGSTPGAKGKWVDKRKEMESNSGKMDYVAGHLLNENLGGPGNDVRNLAAIPQVANKKHSDEVEEKIKEIVNNQHGWVRYEVKTKQAQDASSRNLWYTSAFECDWYQLDPKTKGKVPGTHGHVDIDIPPPSYFNAGNDSLQNAPDKSGKGVDRWDRDHAAAWSKVARKEVVLTNTDDLSSAAAVMKPIQAVLDKMGISDTILDVPQDQLSKSLVSIMKSASVSDNEKKANEVIKTESATLKDLNTKNQLADYVIAKDLDWALENAPIERQLRLQGIFAEAQKLFELIHQAPVAANLLSDVNESLKKEQQQREAVENTARHLLQLVIIAREERDRALQSSIGFANNERSAFGLEPLPKDQSYGKSMEQLQSTEMFDHTNFDYYENMPMTPYRQEVMEEEMRNETEYKDFKPRGKLTVHKHLRENQMKYKSNRFMKEYGPRVEKFSKMSASKYDKKIIQLLSEYQDHQNALVQLRILKITWGDTVVQPIIDMVEAKRDNDWGKFGTACGIISDNYADNGKKYKDIYRHLHDVIKG
ncbi:hypothetical protein [Paenibacillus ferrarius]|uniref:hypothetical protein n=1 Tax=Paenibacillus ferrarius TaxID=1469647 RepID=UPI003D2E776F